MTVDEHHIRPTVNTHAGIYLFHVALEALGLWMVNTETGSGLYPQIAVQHLLNAYNVAVGE